MLCRPQIVTSAIETQNVVTTCAGSELMKNMLPHLLEQLELCQKSLSAYLETKRAEFPRQVMCTPVSLPQTRRDCNNAAGGMPCEDGVELH